jgi:MoaA/NifB/PqqE/SkfB family radical SAM enzyme
MSIIAVGMNNLAVANGLSLSAYSRRTLPDGRTALERAAAYARSLPEVARSVILLPPDADAPQGLQPVRLGSASATELLDRMAGLAEGCDNIFYFFADCPLLDADLSARMLANHRRYFAEYTFADGYPQGLAPEIIKPAMLPALRKLAEASPEVPATARGALFELIKKDINAFELETELAPADLRLLRLSLSADSRRNFLQLERLMRAGARNAESACRLVQDSPELLRTLPAYFSIQIVEGCPQLCSYCPYPRFGISETGRKAEMPPERFAALMERIAGFAEDAVIGVSLWGEPAYHRRFPELAAAAAEKGFHLVVETSGLGWDPGFFAQVRRLAYEEAVRSIEALQAQFAGHLYVQAVRMRENEERLEDLYRYWKEKSGQVIIQKYDAFCGLLPDRKVTDLSPLKRFPCWHLKRDLNVLIDGRVPFCREDVGCRYLLGNLFEEELAEIWARGEPYYLAHLAQEYPELCRPCDEYYTYNF